MEISDSPINIPNTNLDRIAYDSEHERMYVTSGVTNNVFVINTNTLTVTPTDIDSRGIGVAYNPDNQMMYVTAGDRTVKVINTDNNMVITSIPLTAANLGTGIAYDPDHRRMYVPTIGGGPRVDIIDTTNNVLDTTHGPVTVGLSPDFGIAYDHVHQTIYVPTRAVSVIDTDTGDDSNTVVATIAGISDPTGIAYDPVNEKIYVTEGDNAPTNVRVIDTNTNTLVGGPIRVGSAAVGIAYEPVNGRMYVANTGSESVSVIQITTATATIESATDGNGDPVTDGGTTTSDDITFTFTGSATPPTTVESSECSLDDSPFEPCSSPTSQTYTGLELGEHTFAVVPQDEARNRPVAPTTYTWTNVQEEVDPVSAIQDLITEIGDIDGVPNGVQQSLISQLNVALRFISDDNTANDHITCNKLNTFATKVTDFESDGLLTAEQADELLQQGRIILDSDAIGCSSASNVMRADTTSTTPATHSSLSSDNVQSAMSLPH